MRLPPSVAFARVAASVLSIVAAAPAVAQPQPAWPAKPLRLIVPQSAGGSTDLVARPLAQRLSVMWGHQVIAENRPGAGSTIGARTVARAHPERFSWPASASAFKQHLVTI